MCVCVCVCVCVCACVCAPMLTCMAHTTFAADPVQSALCTSWSWDQETVGPGLRREREMEGYIDDMHSKSTSKVGANEWLVKNATCWGRRTAEKEENREGEEKETERQRDRG